MSNNLPVSYKAWCWHKAGLPTEMTLQTVPLQPLGADEALVQNAAIGLNPVDWKVIANPDMEWDAGKVPGVDGAGVVVAVGVAVAPALVGRRVAYHQSLYKPGSFAEYTPVAAKALLTVPDAVNFTTAAGFPCPALTAWIALEKVPLRKGAAVLISGAGGAVGHYLTQLAVARGFAVTAMCNERHWQRLRAFGVTDFLPGPVTAGDALPPSHHDRFFAVIDSVNGAHALLLAPAVEANGHIVCIQGRLEDWPDEPFTRTISLHEVALGATHDFGNAAGWQRLMEAGNDMLQQIAAKTLMPEDLVTDTFSNLPQLLDSLRNRKFSGKPVIQF
ncbi:MAG: hypothetical protein PW788_13890 [Micavibrio sp.]|nr:hypothetical protein [Micavibrio sp.]